MNRNILILILLFCLSCNVGNDYKELFKQANLETDNENYSRAITLLNRVVKLSPDFDSAYAERAYNYYMLDKADQAIRDVNKALEINYNNITAYYYRALVSKYLLSDFDQAIRDYTHIIRTGDTLFHTTALQLRAQTYAYVGDYSKTIADLTEIIRLDSLEYEIWAERGFYRMNYDVTYLYSTNNFLDFTKLPENYRLVYTQDHNNMDKTIVHDTHGAIEDFTKAIEINPEFATAYFYRSRVYSAITLLNIEGALEDINKAIHFGEHSDYYVQRATIFSRYMEKPENALEDLNKAIEINPECGHAFYHRGSLKENVFGDLKGARKDYRIAEKFGIKRN